MYYGNKTKLSDSIGDLFKTNCESKGNQKASVEDKAD